jgi:excisionase family DNA binding protein
MIRNDLITRRSEQVVAFFKSIDKMLSCIEAAVKENRPTLGGERFLTDKEVSERLKVSRRTLQDYRTDGKIGYFQLGGKVLYRESDIEKMLEEGYQKAFDYD